MLISVVVPCFNSEDFLDGLFRSMDAAGMSEGMEAIFVNDGSFDGTLDALRMLVADRPWARFINKPNGGPASARNLGAKNASGDFLLFLDADDELCQGCFVEVRGFLAAHPNEDLYIGRCSIVNPGGEVERYMPAHIRGGSARSNVMDYLDGKLSIQQGGYVIRREAFLDCPFPEGIKTQEDIPFFLASLARYKVCCIPVDMMRYHKYRGSVSKAKNIAIGEGFHNFDILFSPPYVSPVISDLRFLLYRKKARSLLRYIAKRGDLADVGKVFSAYFSRVGVVAFFDLPLGFKMLKTCGYVALRKA